ncbi:MAG: SpoIID/LytB domain-containing protein, partial [Actinomycetia bacterium]|nr:SpoIID/LytB domain-containing protein [Actinomycetes bacterium]
RGGPAPAPAALAAAASAALAAAGHPAAAVTADPGGEIVAVVAGEVLVAPSVWLAAPGGALTLAAGTGAPAAYAGALLFARPSPGSGLWAVDDLPLERYVAGVVAREMPASWPEAALEAQAVACRSYALYALVAGGRAGDLYELVAGPQDQVYGGLGAETPATDEATWATAGEVLTYRGEPIQALYEPDSGGYTAPSADVWGTPVPYLAAVPEPPGYRPLRWREVRTGRELEALVQAATGVDVGPVQAVAPLPPLGPGGRVLALALTGPRGTVTVRDDRVRTALDLPSDVFALRTDAEVAVEGAGGRRRIALALEGLTAQGAAVAHVLGPGERAVVVGAGAARALPAAPAAFTFVGRGLGPGLGMSQDGALYMARQGAGAAAILLYYYRGVELSWWYGGP